LDWSPVPEAPVVLVDKPSEDFIRAQTALSHPPLVPEIQLHLASDAIGLWGETETFATGGAPKRNLPPPYWAFAWPGGQALARYILDHPEEVAGRTVLDFGSGSGLVAIAAAKAGAALVCAADIDPLALVALEMNASVNHVFIEPLSRDLIGERSRWRTVLSGDMCYERPLAERLTHWLKALASEGTLVLLGDPGRNYFPCDSAESGLKRLATYAVPTPRDLEDRELRETSVYLLASN
jgi:predicted nicotinamide N-methyase